MLVGALTEFEVVRTVEPASGGWMGGLGALVAMHRAFVRVKSSYVMGAGEDAVILPEDYEPLAELHFVTDIARAVLELPGALAYFNPGGEVLRSAAGLDDDLAWHREHALPPLPVWANVRVYELNPAWTLMDTIGMEQLDVDDHEACFLTGKYFPDQVANFLRNSTDYVRQHGPVILDGHTMDGPGGIRWQARTVEDSLASRARQVLRWTPQDGSKPPPNVG